MSNWLVTLDRFEGDKAVLITAEGAQLVMPKKYLPTEAREGDILELKLSLVRSEIAKKNKTAKNLLQKILKKQDDRSKNKRET